MHLHAGKIPSGKHTDLKRKEHSDVFFSLFIVAKKRLYVRVCPSVRRVVRRSVGNQLIFFSLLGALYTAFFFFLFFFVLRQTLFCARRQALSPMSQISHSPSSYARGSDAKSEDEEKSFVFYEKRLFYNPDVGRKDAFQSYTRSIKTNMRERGERTDGWTDRRTDTAPHRLASSRLKLHFLSSLAHRICCAFTVILF